MPVSTREQTTFTFHTHSSKREKEEKLASQYQKIFTLAKCRNTANATIQWMKRSFSRYPKTFALPVLLCNRMAKLLREVEEVETLGRPQLVI